MKSTISTLITETCFFSVIFLSRLSRSRSSVMVELEVRTRDESVDMDAESTRMTTIPISRSGSPESMAGMMESKPFATMSTLPEKRRPKPPRK